MTLLTITSSRSSSSTLENSMGESFRVVMRGHRAEKIESKKGTVWQNLQEFPRRRPTVPES